MQIDAESYFRHLAAIGECEDVTPLRQQTMRSLALFGIRSAYFLAPLTRDARVGRIVLNVGLSWVWERQYRARLHLIDPLPALAMDRLCPVLWPDQVNPDGLERKQQRYLGIAAHYGLGRGIGVACFGPNGRGGFLGAILDGAAETPTPTVLLMVQAIGQFSFQRYCRLVRNPDEVPALSNREMEVLHWIGRGKSNSVIAEILQISPSSIDVYIRRIFAKLQVTDRTSASVKAMSLGLIVSDVSERLAEEGEQLLQRDEEDRA